jgi:hypothetical protein
VAGGQEAIGLRSFGDSEIQRAACTERSHPTLRAFWRFHEFMSKRTAPADTAFPGKVFAVSNIPIRVPMHFMGREKRARSNRGRAQGQ